MMTYICRNEQLASVACLVAGQLCLQGVPLMHHTIISRTERSSILHSNKQVRRVTFVSGQVPISTSGANESAVVITSDAGSAGSAGAAGVGSGGAAVPAALEPGASAGAPAAGRICMNN